MLGVRTPSGIQNVLLNMPRLVLLALTPAEIEKRASEARFDVVVFGMNLGVSQRTLERHSRVRFSCTFKQAIEKVRMNFALKLANDCKTTKEIALCLGYKHESHFCRRFKCIAHCTFGEARARIKTGAPLEFFITNGGNV